MDNVFGPFGLNPFRYDMKVKFPVSEAGRLMEWALLAMATLVPDDSDLIVLVRRNTEQACDDSFLRELGIAPSGAAR